MRKPYKPEKIEPYKPEKIEPYNSGADMWHEYVIKYGEAEARWICNRYLDMQVFSKDPEEIQFCRELYAAIPQPVTAQKPSILNDLSDKINSVRDNSKEDTAKKKHTEL